MGSRGVSGATYNRNRNRGRSRKLAQRRPAPLFTEQHGRSFEHVPAALLEQGLAVRHRPAAVFLGLPLGVARVTADLGPQEIGAVEHGQLVGLVRAVAFFSAFFAARPYSRNFSGS